MPSSILPAPRSIKKTRVLSFMSGDERHESESFMAHGFNLAGLLFAYFENSIPHRNHQDAALSKLSNEGLGEFFRRRGNQHAVKGRLIRFPKFSDRLLDARLRKTILRKILPPERDEFRYPFEPEHASLPARDMREERGSPS